MAYVTAEARQQLLDEVAAAVDRIGVALGALGEAYEALDEQAGDRLEEHLFRPVQQAYGRAKRTHGDFASRHGLRRRTFAPVVRGLPSTGAAGFVNAAVEAVGEADEMLAELQDSMLPVEVGDPEIRAGLAEVRRLLDALLRGAREFQRTLGR